MHATPCAASFGWAGALLVLLVVAVTSGPLDAEARSQGVGVCDLTPQVFPIYKGDASRQLWPNGRFGGNYSSSKKPVLSSGYMYWVQAPVPSVKYSLRAGDGAPAADATTYTPDVPVELHLRVLDLQYVYIGLLLYGTNNSGVVLSTELGSEKWEQEVRVGSWGLMPGDPVQLPAACGGTAVSHYSADIKPVHLKFMWSAPKGTGRVVFRVLLKQGEQNTGNFYYPAVELVLREGAPRSKAPNQLTVLGKAGVACADVCATQTPERPFCNAYAMKAQADTVSELAGWVRNTVPTSEPIMSACAYQGPPQISSDGYTSFRAPDGGGNMRLTCPKAYVDAAYAAAPATALPLPDVCYTAPLPDAQAICICDSSSIAQTPNPYAPPAAAVEGTMDGMEEEDDTDVSLLPAISESAASRSAGAVGALLLAASAAVINALSSRSSTRGGGGGAQLLGLLALLAMSVLLVAPAPASAHNFIKSQHRALGASVTQPCIRRIGNQPHVQVIPKQKFEVEWSVGHGDQGGQFYFAALHVDDYPLLERYASNMTAIMNEYLAEAPVDKRLTGVEWQRNHLSLYSECAKEGEVVVAGSSKDCNPLAYFNEGYGTLYPNNSRYIAREAAYKAKAHPSQYAVADSLIKQNSLKAEHLSGDSRAAYKSVRHPWLESVHRFGLTFMEHAAYNGQADIARFHLEATKGAGDYIVFFKWGGYGDCIDVNVQGGSTPIANRYGALATTAPPTVVRIDHCEWTYVWQVSTRAFVVKSSRDISDCVEACNAANRKSANSCNAIQVARVTHPAGTMSRPVNIPWNVRRRNLTLLAELGGDENKLYWADPCRWESNTERELRGCTGSSDPLLSRTGPYAINPKDDDYVCYGTRPARNVDRQVEEDYRIFLDPVDGGWYSTCYLPLAPGGFDNVPPYQYEAPSWKQGSKCISCPVHLAMQSTNTSFAPDWVGSIADTCQNCEQMLSKASVAQLPLVGANQPTAGLPQVNSWTLSAFSACNCSTATQSATLTCQDKTGKVLLDGFCVNFPKPATTRACSVPTSCFMWKQSTWSNCTGKCGTTSGTQTCTVSCVNTAATVVLDAQCSGTKLPTQRTCTPVACNSAGDGSGASTPTPTDSNSNGAESTDGSKDEGANGGAAATSSPSKSFIDTVSDSATYTALCIVALVVLVGAVGVGVALLVRRQLRRGGAALHKLSAHESGISSSELTANPARSSQWTGI